MIVCMIFGTSVYSGKGYVIETLEDFRFKIGPKSFFQTNTEQAEKLYRSQENLLNYPAMKMYTIYTAEQEVLGFSSETCQKGYRR